LQERPVQAAASPLWLLEDVAEALLQQRQGFGRAVGWNRHMAAGMAEGGKLGGAVAVVGMLVCIEHGVQPRDSGIEELRAQVRRRIDQDGSLALLHQHRYL